MRFQLSIALVCLTAMTASVRAEVLVGTSADLSQQGLTFQQNQYLAQQFTFPEPVNVNDVEMTFFLNEGPAFGGSLQIVDRIGVDATAANVLLTVPVTLPSGLPPSTVSVATPISLVAGTYYLLLSTTDPLPFQTRWVNGLSAIPGAPGTVGGAYFSISQNVALPAASPFAVAGSTVAFRINGTVIPEPGSALLLVVGCLCTFSLSYGAERCHARRGG
jgi:hypothetical protein